MDNQDNAITYDSAVAELEEIVNLIEDEEVDLEQVQDLVSRAKELVEFCRKELKGYDRQISDILKNQ